VREVEKETEEPFLHRGVWQGGHSPRTPKGQKKNEGPSRDLVVEEGELRYSGQLGQVGILVINRVMQGGGQNRRRGRTCSLVNSETVVGGECVAVVYKETRT